MYKPSFKGGRIEKNLIFIINIALMVNLTEQQIFISKNQFKMSYILLTAIGLEEYFNVLTSASAKDKQFNRIIIWSYYIIRNFCHYGRIELDLLAHVGNIVMFQEMTSKVFDSYIQSVKRQNFMIQETFQNTLDIVPNGVLICDMATQQITFANQEIFDIVGLVQLPTQFSKIKNSLNSEMNQCYDNLTEKLMKFYLYDRISSSDLESNSDAESFSRQMSLNRAQSTSSRGNQSKRLNYRPSTFKGRRSVNFRPLEENQTLIENYKHLNDGASSKRSGSKALSSIDERICEKRANLFQFILGNYVESNQNGDNQDQSEAVFKSRTPKKYIQVKTTKINGGAQIIAFCTDVSKIKEIEVQGQKMRATFFSSVAHELRTPLNSILPILQLMLDTFSSMSKERIGKFLQVVFNSSLHLQNVIEDALDISRLENNKFTLFKEEFNVKKAIEEVADILRFQIEQKHIGLILEISENVPNVIYSDVKRFKQVLFNLVGNAIKFTFQGQITLRVRYDIFSKNLVTEIQDTGIGIRPEDLRKLFKFFGTLSKSKDINRGGMGLGLTISKMIVIQLGGEIDVESKHKSGSKFSFTIPVQDLKHQAYEQFCESSPSSSRDSLSNHGFTLENQQMPLELFDESEHAEEIKINLKPPKKDLRIDLDRVASFTLEPALSSYSINSLLDTCHDKYQTLSKHSGRLTQNYTFKETVENQQLFKQVSGTLQQAAQKQPLKILCVDDSSYNLFVIEELLKEVDSKAIIHTALNGQIALNIILDHQTKAANKSLNAQQDKGVFDFIFLDLNMPILDGYKTAEQLRSYQREGRLDLSCTKVVALSAIDERQFQGSSQPKHNFDSFMEKPMSFEILRDYIMKYTQY
ncbi:hypothetical protein FGO68_gene1273 [Halteria grandinella]|uniref:Multi-sensor hybrid histidine kinase n=1 Tax=Halteria grandinella TaxID=5974 RepID=A0A8J8P3L4_HALGN|nr:hypothetical protein FGO68_gene1273 [Halteria grandinella]